VQKQSGVDLRLLSFQPDTSLHCETMGCEASTSVGHSACLLTL